MPPPRLPSFEFPPKLDPKHRLYDGRKASIRNSSSLQNLSRYSYLDSEKEIDFDLSKRSSGTLLAGGGATSFSKEKFFAGKQRSRTVVCTISLLLLFSLVAACVLYFSGYWSRSLSNYYVVLDCGSTGTRAFVYEAYVDGEEGNNSGGMPFKLRQLPEVMNGDPSGRTGRAYQRMETEPGLDKLVRNESGLRSAMMPLLHWAEKQIPINGFKRTSVFLFATAGVRKLPNADSKRLLDKAWSILRNSAFVCRRDWVRIISGMEEGYYGWIALNYHSGNLGTFPDKYTLGALDLGGSSLQVTFETEEEKQDNYSLNVSVGAVKHHLKAYSLLGYGLNDAFDKSVVHLLRQLPDDSIKNLHNGELVINHPCLQTGFKEKYVCSLCTEINKEASPTNDGGTAIKGEPGPGVLIQLVGAPNWKECSALALATVNSSDWLGSGSAIDCDIRPCALGDNLPKPQGHFYAMSGFFVVYKFFNLTSEATLDDLLQKGQDFCEETWEVAKNSVVPQPFIEQYCFRAPYVATLLRYGLHLRSDEVVIGSGSITWTLGVALMEAGQALPRHVGNTLHGILPSNSNSWSPIVVIAVSSVLLICAVLFVGYCFHRLRRKPYLPIKLDNSTNGFSFSIPYRFSFRSWIASSGDGRTKMPLSPTVACSEQHSFGLGRGLGGSSIHLVESSLHSAAIGIPHSYSSGSLVLENGAGSFRTSRGGNTQLLSRKSLSREDLIAFLPPQAIKN